MISIDVITRPMGAANALVKQLGPRARRVYVEAFGPAPKRGLFSLFERASSFIRSPFSPKHPREPEIFGAFAPVDRRSIRELPHRDFSIAAEALSRDPPDLIVVLGASLVPASIISAPRVACLNVHLGLAPRYRGLFTTEWAILFGDLENIGVTVHVVTPAVDAGPVVARGRPKLEPEDDARSIDLRLMALGIGLVSEIAEGLDAGRKLAPKAQVEKGRLFLRRDFRPRHATLVERRVRAGMISRFSPRSDRAVEGPFWRKG